MIFIVKVFRTIVFIFIDISITFRPIWPPTFSGVFRTYTDLRTTSFIESTVVACEWWQWRVSLHSLKLLHYWNLTIRLFSVITRTLVGGVLPLCRGAVGVFYSPSQLGKRLAKAWTVIDRLSILCKSDRSDKIKQNSSQATVVSILLYGCTTWILAKYKEKTLHKNLMSYIK